MSITVFESFADVKEEQQWARKAKSSKQAR